MDTGVHKGHTGLEAHLPQKEEWGMAGALVSRGLSYILAPAAGHHAASSRDSDLGSSICGGVPMSTSCPSIGPAPLQDLQARAPPVHPLLSTAPLQLP